ncbi:MAG: hypothetical protein OXG36_06580 [Caldilineaceae bacterium]|nr:hypothetical protein [Caldilineaceae bacterium]
MNTMKAIRSPGDLEAALARIEEIFDAEEGTPEDDELSALFVLVEAYEEENVPIPPPDPISAIKFRMEQAGLTQRDLIPILGSRAKVSEVLSGKRDISMKMARALHANLGIPAESLLQDPAVLQTGHSCNIEWSKFPLREMAKRKWIQSTEPLKDYAEELLTPLVNQAGGMNFVGQSLFRRTKQQGQNTNTDPYALAAWCLVVAAREMKREARVQYTPGTVTQEFLRQVAVLSRFPDGPIQAQEFLRTRGIGMEVVKHLPRTRLDGAAIRMSDGGPVVGLTVRHDRIDSFWFTLLHELAHIGLHLDVLSDTSVYTDDHDLKVANGSKSTEEHDADSWARDALIPPTIAKDIDHESIAVNDVLNLASLANVHPAVVAGRTRHETGNYRRLSQLVGRGEVRSLFNNYGHRE